MTFYPGATPTPTSGQANHANHHLYCGSRLLDLHRMENSHIQGNVENNSELCDKQSGETISQEVLNFQLSLGQAIDKPVRNLMGRN